MPKPDYRTVDTREKLDHLLGELRAHDRIILDLETSNLNPRIAYIVGWAFTVRSHCGWYIPVAHTSGTQLPSSEVIEELKPILEDPSKTIVIQNAKFDTHFAGSPQIQCLANVGIRIDPARIEDSMLEAFVGAGQDISEGWERFGLDELSLNLFHYKKIKFLDLFPPKTKNPNIATVFIEIVTEYACEDVDFTYRIDEYYMPKVQGNFIYRLEKKLWPVVQRIEDVGVKVDTEYIDRMVTFLMAEAEKVKAHIFDQVSKALGKRTEFEINSYTQLTDVLFNQMGLPSLVKTKTGRPSTQDLALEPLEEDYPVVRNILTYRSMRSNAKKLMQDIVDNIDPTDGRVHTQYNQTGATSGRFSSSKPNVQNISKIKIWKVIRADGTSYEVKAKLRTAIVATDDYYYIELDYKQIEFIIMAQLAGEDTVVSGYERSEDVHVQTASVVMHKPMESVTDSDREKAKRWNYLIIYGGGAYGLSIRSGQTESEAQEEIRLFFQARPNFQRYIGRVKDKARVMKKVVTFFGRWQVIPEYFQRGRQAASKAERTGPNRIIQGTAADYHKLGLIKTDALAIVDTQNCVLQTHDSQTWEVHKSVRPQDIIPKLVEAMSLKVKGLPKIGVDVQVGLSWGTLEDYDPETDYSDAIPRWKAEREQILSDIGKVSDKPKQLALGEEAPTADQPSKRILFAPGQKVTSADRDQFIAILEAKPGANMFVVVRDSDGKQVPMPDYPTALSEIDGAVFKPIFPDCKLTLDQSAFNENILQGVNL